MGYYMRLLCFISIIYLFVTFNDFFGGFGALLIVYGLVLLYEELFLSNTEEIQTQQVRRPRYDRSETSCSTVTRVDRFFRHSNIFQKIKHRDRKNYQGITSDTSKREVGRVLRTGFGSRCQNNRKTSGSKGSTQRGRRGTFDKDESIGAVEERFGDLSVKSLNRNNLTSDEKAHSSIDCNRVKSNLVIRDNCNKRRKHKTDRRDVNVYDNGLNEYFKAVSSTNDELDKTKEQVEKVTRNHLENNSYTADKADFNCVEWTEGRQITTDQRQIIMEKEMSENINRLIYEARSSLDMEDEIVAKRKIYEAVVGAQNAKDQLLIYENQHVREEDLANWFGTCAVILHELGEYIMAARCFYTATVFDVNWTVQQHLEVSEVLWSVIMIEFQQQKILELLAELDRLSKLAESRRRWNVCQHITIDTLNRQQQLVGMCSILKKREPPIINKLDRARRLAKCHLELGQQREAQTVCMKILHELTEYDDALTFEIWARSLLIDGQPKLALDKVKLAIKSVKVEDDRERLHVLLKKIQNVLENVKGDTEAVNNEVDHSWLPASHVQGTLKKSASTPNLNPGKTKKSKTRHRRPKPRERTNDYGIQSTCTSANSSRATSPCPQINSYHDRVTIYDRKAIHLHSNSSRTTSPSPQITIYDRKALSHIDDASFSFDKTAHSQIGSNTGKRSRESSSGSNGFSVADMSETMTDMSLWSDSEEGEENNVPESQRIEQENDEDEEVMSTEESFYEQTCRRYQGLGRHFVDENQEIADEKLMMEGIKLNIAYLHKYVSKDYQQNRDNYYSPFLQKDILKSKILQLPDKYKRCNLQIEGSHVSYCYPVESKESGLVVEISGRSKAGQTYNEDEVVVELLDKKHENIDKRYGKVIGVTHRKRYENVKHPVFICTLDDMETHLVRPLCKTVPKVSILNKRIYSNFRKFKRYKVEIYTYDHSSETLSEDPKIIDVNPGERDTCVLLVALIHWSPRSIYPTGAVIRMLKYGDNIERGLSILNLKHKVPGLYERKTHDCVEALVRRQQDIHCSYEERKDLRSLNTFTIDPPGSLDLDDALSIEKISDGYKVGVHIADVSALVRKDDPIDIEAHSRGVTYYPKIRRPRNMLPEPLSSNLCSLLPNQPRRTISVFFLLDEEGRPKQMESKNYQIVKSVIQSNYRLTYREVQDIINSKLCVTALESDLMSLFNLATKIRRRRLGDAMFALDCENDVEVLEDSIAETMEAHYLVEEFMIMANQKVAEVLIRVFPNCTPIRTQPPPNKDSLEEFLKRDSVYVNALIRLQSKMIGNIDRPSIENVREDKSERCIMIPKRFWTSFQSNPGEAMRYLKMDELYPLQYIVYQHWMSIQERASYQCSDGLNSSESKRHYSLDKFPYTHFTSPIRRYNDLVIHRLLCAWLERRPSPYSKHEIELMCIDINTAMKRAKDFERECKALQEAIDLRREPKMVQCYVDESTDRGVSLCAPELKYMEKRQKQLTFNLLDMSRKPEVVEDNQTNYGKVTGFWRKRIYDTKGMSSLPNNRGNEQTLVANPDVVLVPLHSWGRMLKCAIENRQGDLIRTMKSITVYHPKTGLEDVSTESLNPLEIQPNTKFSLTFSHGQTINGQMSSVANKGVLSHKLVLYNMTNNMKVCLHHMDDPVLYLSRYTTRPTSKEYRDSKTYVNTWLPIMSMEAAVGAISNEESCIINNVQIRFDGERSGKFVLSLGFCELRNIEFSGVDEEDEQKNEPKAYDWLCLKYVQTSEKQVANRPLHPLVQNQKPIWVGHAEITSVKKKVIKEKQYDSKLTVGFVLHEKSPKIPVEARKKGSTFGVEILCKSEVDRRTESYIKRLTAVDLSTVAAKIALNKDKMPQLDRGHKHLADLIERDLCIVTQDGMPKLPKNNFKQQEAIDKALTNRFSLIQGPPGTGKSYTGIKLMCLFDKINDIKQKEGGQRHQVLFCGPSNKSVDLVAHWMLTKLGDKMPKFLRVYGRSIEAMEFPIPGRTFLSRRSTHNLKVDERLRPISLHHLIRQKGEENAARINELDKIFKDSNYAPNPELVKKYVHLIREASIRMIRKYDVILCTTAVGSNPKVLEATSVFQVIVDEAGMCPEPQCLVPILATKAEQVVLIGDHKQLRPIIMCKEAAELGLDKSLFERYSDSNRIPFTMLEQQYRMNPHICHFPSKQFYDNKLRTERGMWARDIFVHDLWPTIKRGKHTEEIPHVLVHVEGEEKVLTVSTDEGNEQSKSNQEEIDVVVKVYKYLIANYGLNGSQIHVMSQYNAQVSEIKKRLEAEHMQNFFVSTVVSSQGGEWDYVIFSTVRSLPSYKIEENPTLGWCQQNLGFITDKNQINVALTRARKGIIIIGNKDLLICDNVWKKLISYYESLGCVKTPQEFPPPKRSRQQIMGEHMQRNYQRFGDTIFEPGQATSYEGPHEDETWSQPRGRGHRGRGVRERDNFRQY